MAERKSDGLRSRTIIGMGWSVAMRWSVRAIGLVSTVILARLLSPADFGLVAMAMIVVGLAEVLFELGVNTYLVHKSEVDDDDYSTAWTVRLLQGIAASALMLALVPAAVKYFNAPDLSVVLICLAAFPFIQGLENIGVIEFQKKLNIKYDFYFFSLKKVISFAATITAAILLRNYWALVIGMLTGAVAGVILSYLLHPFRPRLTLCRVRSMISFSSWLLFRNIGLYAQVRIDQLIISGRFGPADIGVYKMASELSELPTSEIVTPLGRVLFPAFVSIKDDFSRLTSAFKNAFGVIVIIGFPMTVGMALIADDFVHLVLGDQWTAVVEPFQVLAFVGLLLSLRYTASTLLTALGHIQFITLIVWVQIVLFVLTCVYVIPDFSINDIALVRLTLGGLLTLSVIQYAVMLKVLTWGTFFSLILRPAIAVTAMALAILYVQEFSFDYRVVNLLVQIPVGGIVYGATLLGCWRLTAGQGSAESYLLDMLMKRFRKPE